MPGRTPSFRTSGVPEYPADIQSASPPVPQRVDALWPRCARRGVRPQQRPVEAAPRRRRERIVAARRNDTDEVVDAGRLAIHRHPDCARLRAVGAVHGHRTERQTRRGRRHRVGLHLLSVRVRTRQREPAEQQHRENGAHGWLRAGGYCGDTLRRQLRCYSAATMDRPSRPNVFDSLPTRLMMPTPGLRPIRSDSRTCAPSEAFTMARVPVLNLVPLSYMHPISGVHASTARSWFCAFNPPIPACTATNRLASSSLPRIVLCTPAATATTPGSKSPSPTNDTRSCGDQLSRTSVIVPVTPFRIMAAVVPVPPASFQRAASSPR